MRLFIAIPLPKDIARVVQASGEELRKACAAGRFVPAGNHHITVRFLGESNALSDIASAMDDAVCDARPFLLRLEGYGTFDRGSTKTGIIRVGGDQGELSRMHETLEAALLDRGFVRGRGRFEPHITLARTVEAPDGFSPFVQKEAFWAHSLVLFESRSENGRPVYAPLHTAAF